MVSLLTGILMPVFSNDRSIIKLSFSKLFNYLNRPYPDTTPLAVAGEMKRN